MPPASYRLTAHETVTVLERTSDVLVAEVVWTAGAGKPPLHSHPVQDERFEVLEGRLDVKLDRDDHHLQAGETIDVPRGSPHAMTLAGDGPTRARWEVRPPGRTEEWWEVVDAATRSGRPASLRAMAGPLREYADTFRLEVAPQWLLRPLLALLARR